MLVGAMFLVWCGQSDRGLKTNSFEVMQFLVWEGKWQLLIIEPLTNLTQDENMYP